MYKYSAISVPSVTSYQSCVSLQFFLIKDKISMHLSLLTFLVTLDWSLNYLNVSPTTHLEMPVLGILISF